jgi:hypothetical protein
MVALGAAVIVTWVVVWYCAQPPAAAIVYVTVYGPPGVLVAGVIAPVAALIVNPAGAEYVPPALPVLVTFTIPDVVQNGVPL